MSPVTVQVVAVLEHDAPPGTAATTYSLTRAPPLEAGALQLTVADALPATALTDRGADGADASGAFP